MIADGRVPVNVVCGRCEHVVGVDVPPPCDSLAEAICLSRMLFRPGLMDLANLGPLLTQKEHRVIWQIMVRVRMQHPELDGADFFDAWFNELKRLEPKHWLNYYDLIHPKSESDRGWQEYGQAVRANPDDVVLRASFDHSFDWWLERLKLIAETRDSIAALQRVSEQLWRVPDHMFDSEVIRDLQARLGALLARQAREIDWRSASSITEALQV